MPVGAERENRWVWPGGPGGVPALEPGVPSLEKHLDGARARVRKRSSSEKRNVWRLHAGKSRTAQEARDDKTQDPQNPHTSTHEQAELHGTTRINRET